MTQDEWRNMKEQYRFVKAVLTADVGDTVVTPQGDRFAKISGRKKFPRLALWKGERHGVVSGMALIAPYQSLPERR